MAIYLKYQVGSCWSAVNPEEMAGGFIYFAELKDAAQYALEMGTGVQPLESYVDLQMWPEGNRDYKGNFFKRVAKNWSEVKTTPMIRHPEVLRSIAEA